MVINITKIKSSPFKFGVEIECFVPYDNISDFQDAVSNLNIEYSGDGSIEPEDAMEGIELKLPPLGLKDMSDLLAKLGLILREYRAGVNESCGLHVHTSNPKFLKRGKLRKILGLWVAIEDVMYSTQPKSRLDNHYCKRRLGALAVDGFPKLPKAKEELLDKLAMFDRYYALNFASITKYGTIECRLHSASINPIKIINWIRLLRKFYNYALNGYEGKIVNKIFTMPLSQKKITRVWNLLELEDDLKTYYHKRIDKFLISTIANQDKIAKKIIKHRKATNKIRQSWNLKYKEAKEREIQTRREYESRIREVQHIVNDIYDAASSEVRKINLAQSDMLGQMVVGMGDITSHSFDNSYGNRSELEPF